MGKFDDKWFATIQSRVFTQVEYMLSLRSDSPYPTMKCTTMSQDTISNFPTLYLHELQPAEAGMDLTNNSVNAVLSTIEIQVWTNTNESECRDILADAILEMKRMQYNVTMFPSVQTSNKIAWGVARFRRMVGAGDALVQ